MMKLFLILLLAQIKRSRCSSWDIIRGDHDMFSSKYIANMSAGDTMNCSDKEYCSCVGDYKTFVYNGNPESARCLKDENIITGQLEGKSYLMKDGKCLGVSAKGKILESTCNKDNLSNLWLWLSKGNQLLNLKELKCLQASKNKKLEIKPCIVDKSDKTKKQAWSLHSTLFLKNDGLNGLPNKKFNCTEPLLKDRMCAQRRSYQGCYQFSNGQFLHLVKSNDCTTRKRGLCRGDHEFNILAPIFRRADKKADKCRLDLRSSCYSKDGYSWNQFHAETPLGISVDDKTPKKGITGLKIKITSSVLKNFPGHLLKLVLDCNDDLDIYERHYVLIKIEGSLNDAVIPTTRPAAKSTTRRTKNPSTQPAISVSTPSSRSSSLAPTSRAVPVNINTSTQSSNTTAIIVSVLVSLFLVVAVVAVVLLCRRRKRSSKQENVHLNQESDSIYHIPGQPGDCPRLSKDNSYECPGRGIPLDRQYEYPVIGPRTTQNPSGTPFTYDYATREITPLVSPEDMRNGNITGLFKSERGGREGEDLNREDAKESKKLPFYNTLENNDETKGDPNEPEYNVLEGPNNKTEHNGPVYNVLEESQKNEGKPKENDNEIEQTDSGPVYNVLEGPQSDGHQTRNEKEI